MADRAQERPPGPMVTPPAADELPGWLTAGAAELVAVLDQTPAATSLWTISQRHHDAAFWRTRMVLETALHRWDADEATGRAPAVDAPVARAGIAETLDVYLEQRLAGREVGGVGQRVVLAVPDDAGWTVTLHADHVEVVRGHVEPTAVVTGTALDLWLLLACRRDLTALTVDGDVAAAELLVRGASMVPGPAG